MKQSGFVAALVLGWVPLIAFGDSIVLDGVAHSDVIVRESSTMYYVQFPKDGSIRSVRKSAVDPKDVSIKANTPARAGLKAQWRANNDRARIERGLNPLTLELPKPESNHLAPADFEATNAAPTERIELHPNGEGGGRTQVIASPQAVQRLQAAAGAFLLSAVAPTAGGFGVGGIGAAPGPEIVTDGVVPYVNLRNVSLRDALHAILRPLNLDFSVEPGFIWISTPEKLRQETFEDLETRYYDLRSAAAETLFKIVVSNPGG